MLGSGRACVLGGVVAAPPVGWALIPADHDGAPPLGKATFPYQSNFHGASSVSNRSAGATAHSPFLVVSRPLGTPRHGTRCDWRAAVRARVRAPRLEGRAPHWRPLSPCSSLRAHDAGTAA